jgi:hypothetical protein
MFVQQLTVRTECEHVDPVLVPGDRGWSVVDSLANRLPASPPSLVPRPVLQRVLVALAEQVKPTQAPRRHSDIGVLSAAEVDGRQPRQDLPSHSTAVHLVSCTTQQTTGPPTTPLASETYSQRSAPTAVWGINCSVPHQVGYIELLRDDLARVEVPAGVHGGEESVDHVYAGRGDFLLQPGGMFGADGVVV